MIIFYFGYIPITTVNGEITDDVISNLQELDEDSIKVIPTMHEIRSMNTVIELTNGHNMEMPSKIPVSELEQMLNSGITYESIADNNNNCIALMVPLKRYTSAHFDIIDEITNTSIKHLFQRINCIKTSDCNEFILLCMFNDKWAYADIGKNKIVSPLKLVIGY